MAREQSLENEPWYLIDPEPENLSQLCVQLGVQGVQVQEMRSLSLDSFREQSPMYGIILLLQHKPERYQRDDVYTTNHNIYFANQVVNDAYALYALLSVLLNHNEDIDLGSHLTAFKEFTDEFSPVLKGLSVTNSKAFKDAHNSVTRARHRSPSRLVRREDVYHYISYVPIDGHLWELDGFKRGPLRLAPCTKSNWFEVARTEVQRKIDLLQRQQISVSILSVVEDRRAVYERRILGKGFLKSRIEQQLDRCDSQWRTAVRAQQWEEEYRHSIENEGQKRGLTQPFDRINARLHGPLGATDFPPDECAELVAEIQNSVENVPMNKLVDLWLHVQDESLKLFERLGDEHVKHQQSQDTHLRRQHNYIPFIESYIACLLEHGHLQHILNQSSM